MDRSLYKFSYIIVRDGPTLAQRAVENFQQPRCDFLWPVVMHGFGRDPLRFFVQILSRYRQVE